MARAYQRPRVLVKGIADATAISGAERPGDYQALLEDRVGSTVKRAPMILRPLHDIESYEAGGPLYQAFRYSLGVMPVTFLKQALK